MFNPKSYLFGKELLHFAKIADKIASENPDISVFISSPYPDISLLCENTKNIIVTAQHLDGINPGRGMGYILPESIYNAGARATFLNHAERPLPISELVKAINRTNELGIVNIVCADSIREAKAVAILQPDIILCEPTELIGTGKTSNEHYITTTNEAIKSINPNTLVMQGAGISMPEHVYNVISIGADGTGCTSGILKANNPKLMFEDMVEALVVAKNEAIY